MAGRPSLEDLLKDVPHEKLDQPCRHDHLSEIALSITRWKSIAPFLGLSKAEEENIEKDCAANETQKIGMLRKWRERFGRKATYRKLVKVFFKLDRVDLVEEVCELLQTESSGSSSEEVGPPVSKRSILDSYAEYLRRRYRTERPMFFTLQWPPPPTRTVFKLAIIGHPTIQRGPINEELVRLTLRGNVDDIMRMKRAVQLENIFSLHPSGRKVILIEGAPGAGKSTLAWHICQKWESGDLFQEFNVVVFVQLRDPAVQAATFLADILPARASDMRTKLLSIKQADDGHGVLFVLDGWDEYGPGLKRGSLFWNIICKPEDLNMSLSSLIITSRPIASGELQKYASSRIEIVGFTPAEVKKYFSECIGDTETEQKLQDHLRERPVIEASCYLPLNAAIIVHLFLALNHTLPHTLHEVFLSLVLCCIIRHLTKEAEGGRPHISSLDDLPPDIQEPFNNICTMAYHGVMKNRATFSASELRSFNLPKELTTLSLIQGVQSFTAFEQTVLYNFLHLSVQELLAAFHVSKLSATEQIQIFNELFDQPRLAAVFRFYAAFTKLQTVGVRDIVARIVQKQQKPLLVNLLHGLYEAQDPSLCQFVASHLKGRLDLSGNTLSPMDCLVVGYFLSVNCFPHLEINLSNCGISAKRCKAIGDALMVNTSLQVLDLHDNPISAGVVHIAEPLRHNHSLLEINLSDCGITEKGGKAIGEALMVNRSLLVLDLHGNPISAGVVHIAESLKHNHSLLEIRFGGHGLSVEGVKAICEALMVGRRSLRVLDLLGNSMKVEGGKAFGGPRMANVVSVQMLDLEYNPISAGVVHIAESLKHNHSLQEINLYNCCVSEKGGKAIGDALMVNTYLQVLDLQCNPISAGVIHIAESLKHNHSLLEINLSRSNISEKGGEAIGEALVVNRSLQVLDLHGNAISAGVVYTCIAESLRHNHSLLEINLLFCVISQEGGKAIGDALMVNRSLRVLHLHNNPISAGVVHISESLKCNHSLLKINLSNCGISKEEAESLAISLKENCTLQTLILSGNNLSDCARITDSLRYNNCLKRLYISHCGLRDRGLISLGSALKVNSSLKELDLTWNGAVTAVGLLALGESLKRNRGLKTLKLLGLPNISDDDWKQFVVCLQENNHLTELELLSSTQEVVRQEMTTLNNIRGKNNLPPLCMIQNLR